MAIIAIRDLKGGKETDKAVGKGIGDFFGKIGAGIASLAIKFKDWFLSKLGFLGELLKNVGLPLQY